MSVGDMPTFAASTYAASSFSLMEDEAERKIFAPFNKIGNILPLTQQQEKEAIMVAIGRRFVQVIVSDPEPLIPLEKCILYKGEPLATDLTDQELYFELNIKQMLEEHNNMRMAIVNKNIKDRTEYLEPAKIRDLKMTVVKIADL